MRRLIILTFVLVSTQLLLLHWFSRKPSNITQPVTAVTQVEIPTTSVASATTILQAHDAPALYVLPSLHGFSGPAWLRFTPQQYTTPAWTEAARELPAPVEKLGESVAGFVEKKTVVNLAEVSQWEKVEHDAPATGFATNIRSHLEIRDGLALWSSNSIPPLKPQLSAEILRASVVLAGVDENGNVFSAILLPYGKSGSTSADAEALALSRAAKFYGAPASSGTVEPNSNRDPLHWGRLVFHWATESPADATQSNTNTPQ